MTPVQKILIIEDDRLQFRVTEKQLAGARIARFESDWAQTYEDGLRLLLTGEYAACLLDFQLGERDGLVLLREARAQHNETPVIFLTADASEAVDEAALEAGASDYLVKGEITPRILERAIRYSLKLGAALRELRDLSLRDQLTGLLNRRALTQLLGEEVERARRLKHPLSVVMLDIDHFKSINDTHGHPIGDAVLAAVAARFGKEVRSIDRVARIGGEEFAVVLMETDVKSAFSVAMRLVTAVRETPVTLTDGTGLNVTISAGVAGLPPYGVPESELLNQADQALYAAKRAGRDRAVLAS